MKYLDFEKHIKNELGNSKEPVQMDALLSSLNLRNEQTKGKGFAFWMLLPFLLLTVSFVAWQFMDGNNTNNGASILTEEISNTEKQTIDKVNDKSDHTIAIAASLDQQSKQDGTIDNELLPEKENISTTLIKNNEVSGHLDASILTNDSEVISNSISTTAETPNDNSSLNLLNESKNTKTRNSDLKNQNSTSANMLNTNSTSGSIMPSTPIAKASRDLLSIEDINNSVQALEENDFDGNMFKRMKINCPSFDNSGWHLALIPEVGIFKPFKTLENTSSEMSEAFNERFESETTLEGLEIGLHGMLVRDNVPFYLKTGLSYTRISERMELKYEYVEMDTTLGIISSTVSANGDTITHIYGDIITSTTFKGSNRQHHYIHLFDIPISVGYSTYVAGLDVGIEAGIRLNFMTRATGNLLVSGNEYSNLSLNKLFKNRIGISYTGGLMIGRNFGRYGDIFIAPRVVYYPNNFNNQSNSINQKYFNVGLTAGVVYKIN